LKTGKEYFGKPRRMNQKGELAQKGLDELQEMSKNKPDPLYSSAIDNDGGSDQNPRCLLSGDKNEGRKGAKSWLKLIMQIKLIGMQLLLDK
jgi:hypothetical protein